MGVAVCESVLRMQDGTKLYHRTWSARGDASASDEGSTTTFASEEGPAPQGILYFIHGLGEHCSRYDALFAHFASLGLRIHAIDLRGHGRSLAIRQDAHVPAMKRGHIGSSFGPTHSDIDTLLGVDGHLGVPRFLMGHSMGGYLVLAHALGGGSIENIHGVIASAPALGLGTPVPQAKIALGRLVGRLLPSFTIGNGLDMSNISRDPLAIRDALADPLVHHQISLATAACLIDGGIGIRKRPSLSIPVPVLLAHGSGDIMTCHEASREFVSRLQSPDKTFRSFPDAFHSLHVDIIKDEVIEHYCEWLLAQMQRV